MRSGESGLNLWTSLRARDLTFALESRTDWNNFKILVSLLVVFISGIKTNKLPSGSLSWVPLDDTIFSGCQQKEKHSTFTVGVPFYILRSQQLISGSSMSQKQNNGYKTNLVEESQQQVCSEDSHSTRTTITTSTSSLRLFYILNCYLGYCWHGEIRFSAVSLAKYFNVYLQRA